MRTSNLLAFLGQMITAAVAAVVVSVVALTAIARVEWPAFPSSNQLHALTTVGQVSCLVGLVVAGALGTAVGKYGESFSWNGRR